MPSKVKTRASRPICFIFSWQQFSIWLITMISCEIIIFWIIAVSFHAGKVSYSNNTLQRLWNKERLRLKFRGCVIYAVLKLYVGVAGQKAWNFKEIYRTLNILWDRVVFTMSPWWSMHGLFIVKEASLSDMYKDWTF